MRRARPAATRERRTAPALLLLKEGKRPELGWEVRIGELTLGVGTNYGTEGASKGLNKVIVALGPIRFDLRLVPRVTQECISKGDPLAIHLFTMTVILDPWFPAAGRHVCIPHILRTDIAKTNASIHRLEGGDPVLLLAPFEPLSNVRVGGLAKPSIPARVRKVHLRQVRRGNKHEVIAAGRNCLDVRESAIFLSEFTDLRCHLLIAVIAQRAGNQDGRTVSAIAAPSKLDKRITAAGKGHGSAGQDLSAALRSQIILGLPGSALSISDTRKLFDKTISGQGHDFGCETACPPRITPARPGCFKPRHSESIKNRFDSVSGTKVIELDRLAVQHRRQLRFEQVSEFVCTPLSSMLVGVNATYEKFSEVDRRGLNGLSVGSQTAHNVVIRFLLVDRTKSSDHLVDRIFLFSQELLEHLLLVTRSLAT